MHPFSEGDSFAALEAQKDQIRSEINDLDNNYVLCASITELEEFFLEKGVIKPLVLESDQYFIESQASVRVDVSRDPRRLGSRNGRPLLVPGTQLQIAIPYTGAPILWRLRPSTFSVRGYPEIEIRDDAIMFKVTFPDDSADSNTLKASISREVAGLADAVSHLAKDVESYNEDLRRIVPKALNRKREMALAATNVVASLGIPVKRADRPATYNLPVRRRPNPIRHPASTTAVFEPEPTLEMKEYDYALSIMRSMSLVIERNPLSFSTLNEETIRDFFLLMLNSHFKGDATGETFNAQGKTDILIRSGERNAFVAECKFWRGPKKFDEAITQLLSYLAWRDSKSAILVFNRNLDSSSVCEKMHEVILARSEFRKTIVREPIGDSRYILVKDDDPGREITLSTQIYDVPSPHKQGRAK